MNWLDWLIAALIIASIWGGFRQGFVRMGIGFAALIVGFIAASWFYGAVGAELMPWVHSKAVASVLGFILVYAGVMVIGTIIAAIVVRVFKLVGLTPVDRLLGAALGLVRAAIVVTVATLVVMAFAPKRMPAAVHESTLAPYILGASDVFSSATPYDIKEGFRRSYAEIRRTIRDLGPRASKTLPVREE
jgi:membrane protein required for colicin V production